MSAEQSPEQILASVEPIEPRPARPFVALIEAQLCINCDTIYSTDPGEGCPRCGSRVAFSVGRLIAPKTAPAPWRKP